MAIMKKNKCQLCHQSFSLNELFPTELMRPAILSNIKAQHPDWDDKGYVCLKDLRFLRNQHIEQSLLKEKGELSLLDKEVLESLEKQKIVTENINEQFAHKLTFGERVSDRIAKAGGSWSFILSFLALIFFWTLSNAIWFRNPLDPFPFILLNLILSCIAAIQAPVIMMSQNRQAARDRLQLDDNYRTNLKAELEIKLLHSKIDLFTKNQWDRMLELQQMQMDLLEELLDPQTGHTSNGVDPKKKR